MAYTPIPAGASSGLAAGAAHDLLGELTDDDHTQYARLAGRAGGQTLQGGTAASEILLLQSTANATKGNIRFGGATGFDYDETTKNIGNGVAAGTFGYNFYVQRGTTAAVAVESTVTSGSAGIELFSAPRGATLRCSSYGVAGTTQGELSADLTALTTSGCDRLMLGIAGDFSLIFVTNSIRRLAINSTAFTVWDGGNFVLGTATGTKWGTATGEKQAWWGVTPVVQQVLATGAAATVDNVITFLQTIGLCKQS